MDKKLIVELIKSNSSTCPEIAYESPLLDRNVAVALSKSFISILNISKQNSNINNSLRYTVLQNIRNLCRFEPEGHKKIDEQLTRVINEFYLQYLKEAIDSDNVVLKLDHLLVREFKDLDIFSKYQSAINPEVIQALLNHNNKEYVKNILKDVLHWKDEYAAIHLLKQIWNDNIEELPIHLQNDISIRMRKEIERILLQICDNVLTMNNIEAFDNSILTNICYKCCYSPQCFQICCNILNSIFIMTNFNCQIEKLVHMFIILVKSNLKCLSFSEIYPRHLRDIVLYLDVNVNSFDFYTKQLYTANAKQYLQNINGEYDLVMLFLHFPDWFDIYFGSKNDADIMLMN